MRRVAFGLTLMLAAAPAPGFSEAGDPRFAQPIDCVLGDTCFLLNLPDADPGDGAADYTCGPRSYDTHKGTDFALTSLAAMQAGVQVLAAAPGTVRGTRNQMDEGIFGSEGAPDVTGRECGNGVSIDHGGGWISQYCHMAKGSVQVRTGDRLRMGQPIGKVGLSGKTQYPHLHVSFRKDGKVVDPFNPRGEIDCGTPTAPEDQLWQVPLDYPAGGIVSAGFAPDIPSYAAVKAGTASHDPMPTDGAALVGWSFVYGTRQGDLLQLQIDGPQGVVAKTRIKLEKTQVLAFRAFGKKTKSPWPAGVYRLQSWMIRDGKVLDALTTEATLR